MSISTIAKRLASLGHENRLELFQVLVQSGPSGLTIGELQSALERPASTLAFALRELVQADLVTQEKEGRAVRCKANYLALNEMIQFVQLNCCQGVTVRSPARKTPR